LTKPWLGASSREVFERGAIGVIGGSGLYALEELQDKETVRIETPFGEPSDAFVTGHIDGARMVFLPRHGVGHRLLPSEINFRANIMGMKMLGVTEIISVSAVGSMREEIASGDMVMVDQFIDMTKSRPQTFFGDGAVAHVPLADPVCHLMQAQLHSLAQDLKFPAHACGTYLCIEGPQFSTRAESRLFRHFGVDVIGMTNLPEARLAREAEICYATIALATDYDCWHETEDDVSVEAVLRVLRENVQRAQKLILEYARSPADTAASPCHTAARTSLLTALADIPPETRRKLHPILSGFETEKGGER
jgi:5'-methylthioadenosine phosphorylase